MLFQHKIRINPCIHSCDFDTAIYSINQVTSIKQEVDDPCFFLLSNLKTLLTGLMHDTFPCFVREHTIWIMAII